MARETVAQRNARLAAEREARLAAEVAEYPARLMAVLERVNNQYNLTLTVQDGMFLVSDNNPRYNNETRLSYSWDAESQDALQNLEWSLTNLEEAQAEEKRRNEVRREAKRKAQEMFTAEERELLGLD